MAETGFPRTARELLRLPRESRCELVGGEPRPVSPAGWVHGQVAMRIGARLLAHCDAHGLGSVFAAETGFVLGREPDTVLAPDVSFVRAGRSPGPRQGFWDGPPDLAVEVVSPSDAWTRVDEKVRMWIAHGCPLLLVVDPERRLARSYRASGESSDLGADGVFDAGDVVPGFRLPLRDLWPAVDD